MAGEFTLARLAELLGGEVAGDGGVVIRQVAPLERAGAHDIAFVAQARYLAALQGSSAGAVILPHEARDASALPRILTPNPYLYFARVSALLNPPARPPSGVHDRAWVAPTASLGEGVSIAAGAVVEEGATIGARSIIGPNCGIGAGVSIGEDCQFHAGVVVYHGCRIGSRVILHGGSVIGADGFGLANDAGRWVKIPQIGRVVIGDDVEVGANTTIDRGALDDTVVGEGVKLDNLVQVGHNVRIGAHTAIAACVGIAGSTTIGAHCLIGGAAMIQGHIEITDRVIISAATAIGKSIREPGTYTGIFPSARHQEWQKNAVRVRHLDELTARVKALENYLQLQEKSS